jgi:hypothetical protein
MCAHNTTPTPDGGDTDSLQNAGYYLHIDRDDDPRRMHTFPEKA